MLDNDFVSVIKVNGKILREEGHVVHIPFDSEYSILMKNLRAVKAAVSISIDGEDVLNGHQLIVHANDELELERFLKDNNEGHRFKYIQKTDKIQDHRGDKIDDGIVRVKFQFEQPPALIGPIVNYLSYGTRKYVPSSGDLTIQGAISTGNTFGTNTSTIKCSATSNCSNMMSPSSVNLNSAPLIDEGITVGGSISKQQFCEGIIGLLEPQEYVITLQLKGYKDNGQPVKTPLTVQTKKLCRICGTKSNSNIKFCPECGTALDW